jgi:hypothetical protein
VRERENLLNKKLEKEREVLKVDHREREKSDLSLL